MLEKVVPQRGLSRAMLDSLSSHLSLHALPIECPRPLQNQVSQPIAKGSALDAHDRCSQHFLQEVKGHAADPRPVFGTVTADLLPTVAVYEQQMQEPSGNSAPVTQPNGPAEQQVTELGPEPEPSAASSAPRYKKEHMLTEAPTPLSNAEAATGSAQAPPAATAKAGHQQQLQETAVA